MTGRRGGGGRRVAAALALVLAAAGPVRGLGLTDEQELGARFGLEARRALPLVRDPALTGYLQRVGGRMVEALPSRTFAYRFFVVRDPSLNAFAVPGGWVYVHTGLLMRVTSEAELAGVLGHEIVHVSAHHAVRQQEQTALVNYGTLLGIFLSAVHPALGASALAAGQAVTLKYQREYEREADTVGFDLMRTAGYDPGGMARFLRRVEQEQRLNPTQVPPYFLSHPLTEDRVATLEQRTARMPPMAPRPADDSELAVAQAIARVLTEPRATVLDDYRARVARAPDDPEAAHLLGVVYLHGGEPAEAEPLLARAAAAGRPRAAAAWGAALVRLGRHTEARPVLERHLAATPADPAARLDLARTLIATGELRAADAVLAQALAADPELDDAEFLLGESAGKRGDARGQWWHLGRAFELRGDLERAASAYERARDASPADSPERTEAEQARRALSEALGPFGP